MSEVNIRLGYVGDDDFFEHSVPEGTPLPNAGDVVSWLPDPESSEREQYLVVRRYFDFDREGALTVYVWLEEQSKIERLTG